MKIPPLHPWPQSVPEATRLQEELRAQLLPGRLRGMPRTVAGAIVDFDKGDDRLYTAVVVVDSSSFEVVEVATRTTVATFPYLPGYLSFREIPPLVDAFSGLTHAPDLVVVNRHGHAHPRRIGMACHLGLWLQVPVLGVCPQLLMGEPPRVPKEPGSSSPLVDENNGELVGMAVRTRLGAPPVYVSVGRGMTLPEAAALTLALCRGRRMPEPLRLAQREAARLRGSVRNLALDPEIAALVRNKGARS
ncbi:MAG: endonuclease V [Deltaproteobacteria bacterium]|nr:endonuclease V [Deltaproteobacteria bacterium]